MTNIAIIPARGGSKRLPRKNIIEILGSPALFYPVRAALNSGLFDRVIVSTDDNEIKEKAEESGAEVFIRPEKLAQDSARVVDVCFDVLGKLGKQGIKPRFFCCIYATAVFIRPEDLINSYKMINSSSNVEVVMGVSQYNLHPVQALETGQDFLTPKWPEYIGIQSQKHPELVGSNGTLYWANTITFIKQKSFYMDKLKGYEMPWIRAIDLDTPEDLENARMLAPLFLKKE